MAPSRALLFVIWAAVAAGCTPAPTPSSTPAPLGHPVRVAEVAEAPGERVVVLHGVTRAVDRATLSFAVPGRVQTCAVEIGQRVEAGEVIATLDPAGLSANLSSAKATVQGLEAQRAQLKRDRRRAESLEVGTTVAQAEIDTLRAQEARVEASLAGARAQAQEAGRLRGEASLQAPLPGLVVEVLVEPGELVQPGQPVVRLAGAQGVEVEVQAPERVWAHLASGQPAVVELPHLDRTTPASIHSVAAAAGRSGLMPVVVTLQDPEATAGLTANVVLSIPVEPGVAVPLETLVDPVGGAPSLFVVRQGRAARVPVELGTVLQRDVVVSGALDIGERVVSAGQESLLDGDAVEVIQ